MVKLPKYHKIHVFQIQSHAILKRETLDAFLFRLGIIIQ